MLPAVEGFLCLQMETSFGTFTLLSGVVPSQKTFLRIFVLFSFHSSKEISQTVPLIQGSYSIYLYYELNIILYFLLILILRWGGENCWTIL